MRVHADEGEEARHDQVTQAGHIKHITSQHSTSAARTAYVIGYVYVFAAAIIANAVTTEYFNDPDTEQLVLWAIQIIPSFAMYRGLLILSRNVANNAGGMVLADIFTDEPAMFEALAFLLGETLLLFILAYYFQQILPSAQAAGVAKKPWFCFEPSFWCESRRRDTKAHSKSMAMLELDNKGAQTGAGLKPSRSVASILTSRSRKSVVPERVLPDDIRREMELVRSQGEGREGERLLVLDNLIKVYAGLNGGAPVKAVKGVTMGVRAGECFGFLGPNGAGKTTLMNMLNGLVRPTAGSASFGEFSIHTDLERIHAQMGVCPQDNLLWGDLSGREHLLFYARLKGLQGQALQDAVDESLQDVGLEEFGMSLAKEYSGGMQRRLSVACALIGKPRLVVLDEPTTGLDPANRRKLWDVIQRRKTGSVYMLTTHAMDEAEALCDRLSIIAGGELQCLGTSAELKTRFGKGYRITVTVSHKKYESDIQAFMKKICPEAQMLNALAGTVNYEAPRDSIVLHSLFAVLQDNKESLHIVDWGVQNTTLEEVFLAITKEAEKDQQAE